MVELQDMCEQTPQTREPLMPASPEDKVGGPPNQGLAPRTRQIIMAVIIIILVLALICIGLIIGLTVPKEDAMESEEEKPPIFLTTNGSRTTTTTTTTNTITPVKYSTTTTTNTSLPPGYKECGSLACVAEKIKMMMGNTKPCEDFYQYACGGVMSKLDIKPWQPGTIARDMIKAQLDRQNSNDATSAGGKIKAFYDSCLNARSQGTKQDRTTLIKEVFGSYHFIEKAMDYTDFTFDLSEALGYMMRKGFTPFFSIGLEVDSEDKSAFMLSLHPTVPGSPFSDDPARKVCLEEHYSKLLSLGSASYNVTEEYDTFMKCVGTGKGLEARLARMEDAVAQLGLMNHLTAEKSEQLLKQTLSNTEYFLMRLSEKQPYVPHLVRKLANVDYEDASRDVSQLDDTFINWVALLSTFLDVDKSVISSYRIIVHEEYSLHNITEFLSGYYYYNFSPAILNNILVLLWAERVYTDFVEPVGASVGDPEYCLKASIALMEDTASYLYLQAVAPDVEARNAQIDEIAANIKREGRSVMRNISTDDASTRALEDKLEDMMDNVVKLNKVHGSVATMSMEGVSLSEDFLHNSLLLLAHRSVLMGTKLGHGTDDMWRVFAHPYDPLGFYSYPLNRIMFPYAALEPFQGFKHVPDYLHYASTGQQIAHLMWHGYDTSGVSHQSAIQLALLPLLMKFRDMYLGPRSYTNPKGLTAEYNMTDLTLNEIWADTKATDLAWRAYINKNLTTYHPARFNSDRYHGDHIDPQELSLPHLDLSAGQLYYLHWAQQYCSDSSDLSMLEVMERRQPPRRERVNFVIQHSEYFRRVYHCT